ncbi:MULTISPECIES: hypothetical protein [unclassified Hahella]|uniref:hypothetical protein n=1 Tax=unclassified Hahella TaxID=2624107 RepID=UPI000FDEF27B|nr:MULTISPECIES: hypothetical protein [unclassified Hahella]AZZ90145.1 hypothetical protein ENC22_02690 [Hahella sp. KA22]MBU6954083.1 hypothetical protein [Hahella sp. HN01]MDG9668828.1 hypothetical protein [Hahella sp. CR1]QAY53515.1 hypothetical protein EUZ85_05240 [Hahella sp. KA22]WLQ12544.1 hypothetical protein O5O45_22715 [Hahella sp. HNIBRBA332]
MPTLVQAIFGRGQAKLKRLLKDYPPYQAPHSQEPFSLTIEQAYANLNYLIAEKANRLVIYGELLRKFGLDLDEGLHNASPEAFLRDLHAWAYKHWPEVYEPHLARKDIWLNSKRDGDHIVFSMLMDTAIALGEIVVKHRPRTYWGLDLSNSSWRLRYVSYQRPVLLGVPDPYQNNAFMALDFENTAFFHYSNILATPQPAQPLGVKVLYALREEETLTQDPAGLFGRRA